MLSAVAAARHNIHSRDAGGPATSIDQAGRTLNPYCLGGADVIQWFLCLASSRQLTLTSKSGYRLTLIAAARASGNLKSPPAEREHDQEPLGRAGRTTAQARRAHRRLTTKHGQTTG